MSRRGRDRRGGRRGRSARSVREPPEDARPATVVAVHGMRVTVLDHGDGARVRCRPLADRTQLAVGDRVRWADVGAGPEVLELATRQRCLWRTVEQGRRLMAANVDRVAVVAAVHPTPHVALFDRFLVAADAEDIDVLLVLNKIDLDGCDEARERVGRYRELGYPIVETSASSGEGVDRLRAALSDGMTVMAGQSGVGKSSLLNRLHPEAEQRTGEVSEARGRGRHVTSAAAAFELGERWPRGGLIVDTPGIRAFGLHGLDPVRIAHGFRELRPWLDACRFRDCLHDHEPGCTLREAVERGEAPRDRYERYRELLHAVQRGEG